MGISEAISQFMKRELDGDPWKVEYLDAGLFKPVQNIRVTTGKIRLNDSQRAELQAIADRTVSAAYKVKFQFSPV